VIRARFHPRDSRYPVAHPNRPHDLRHGAATLALAAGTELQLVSATLGHASIQLTADAYTSVLPDAARVAAENTAALLFDTHRRQRRHGHRSARRFVG
jgi:integrase